MNPSYRLRVSRLMTGLALGAFLSACQSSSVTGGEGLTPAAGTPSQVVYVTNSVAGGQRVIDSLVIDSASGNWSQSQCGPRSATDALCAARDFVTVSGNMESYLRVPLFERARRTDFQMLRSEYRRTGVIPPDAVTHVLQIVQNGRRRTVTWESGATIPPAISSYLCALLVSRGWLISCAD